MPWFFIISHFMELINHKLAEINKCVGKKPNKTLFS